jgi:hypothetical protein
MGTRWRLKKVSTEGIIFMDQLRQISEELYSRLSYSDGNADKVLGEKKRNRSRTRIFNEASAELIRKRIGGLQGFINSLQLTPRRTCELLLIDPSTWSRWKANENLVPPHSWRAMEWYLALQDKIPGLSTQYFLTKESGVTQVSIEKMVREELKKQYQKELLELGKLAFETTQKLKELTQQTSIQDQNQAQAQVYSKQNSVWPIFFAFIFGSILTGFLSLLMLS